MSGKKKPNLLRGMRSGREQGAGLVERRNPTQMRDAVGAQDVEALLAEAREKSRGTLWERELAATALRSIDRSLLPAQRSAVDEEVSQIQRALDASDDEELRDLRARLAARTLTADAFRAELDQRPNYSWDAFTQRLLEVHKVPERETERPAGMVHYLPSPMDAILAIVDTVTPDDVFYDIGSGLGLVTMLVSWLSGARARGVELEPAYHRHAVALSERLGIGEVSYVCGDARSVEYGDGSVFYIYDTFRGQILEDMIQVLRGQGRSLRVISRGQSNQVFAAAAGFTVEGPGPSQLLFLRTT